MYVNHIKHPNSQDVRLGPLLFYASVPVPNFQCVKIWTCGHRKWRFVSHYRVVPEFSGSSKCVLKGEMVSELGGL